MEEFVNLHNRTVSRSEVERVISIAKEQNNTEVIYRLSRILNAYPTEQRFVINIKDYPAPPTALAGAHHTGDYREALDDCGRLKKGWKFSKGQVVKVTPKAKKTSDTPTATTAVESKQLVPYTAEKFANDLDINKLERSLHWLSFDPKGRAKREQESYANIIAELYNSHLEQAKQTGALEAYNATFDKGYSYILKNYLEMVGIRARTFSTAITGGGNISERKIANNEKLMRSEHERLEKHIELQEKLKERLAKIAKNTPVDQYEEGEAIKSTDIHAIKKLQEKIKAIEAEKDFLKRSEKAVKEYQRTNDFAVFSKYDIPDDKANEYIDQIKRFGYALIAGLQNRTAEIRRIKERIATLEKNQSQGEKETLIEGGKIVYNGEAQRLQIFFDGIPSKEVREALKSHAFKWAPTAKAWQRTLTENAKYAVKQYLIKTGILKLRTALSVPSQDDELTFLAAAGIDYFEQAPDDKAQGLGKPIPAADIYKMITDKIIKMLKSTKASDYKKTWEDDAFFIPLNFDSKKPYRGVNRMLLQERIGLTEAFANPYFLTFKQIKKHKGTLKKGAKGYEVVYYSIRYVVPADKNSGRKAYSSTNAHKVIDFLDKHKLPENIVTRIPMIRYYNVYNGEDITGIDFKLPEVKIGRAVPDTAPENQAAALIVENYPNPPAIKHGGNEAYYKLSEDLVRMPKIEQFDSVNDYYRTLFHELTHSTRHESRLNREKISFRFGDSGYAKEELVAEFGAVFLSAWAGIMWYNNKNHAAYLKGWNSAIKEAENDNKFLMKAASLAQAATDYILNLDAAGQPAFLSKYEKSNKAEKPEKKASASKIQIIPPYPIDIESNEENDDYMQLEKELSDLMGDKFEVWANNLIEQKRKARLAERSKEIKANIDTLKNKEKGATAYEYVRNEYGYNYKVDKKDTKKYEVTLTIYRYGSFNPNENYYDTFKTPEECSAFIIKTLDEQDGFYYSNWYGLSELQNKINELKGYQYSKQFHYQEEEKKAEKTKPEVSKPESSLYEAFSKLLSQIKSTNADIPSNELEDFLYNFGSQHYIEKEKIYTFFYDKVTKPIGSLSAYKKHPLFTKVKNPQPHHAGYTTTKRGTEVLNIFIKDFEALKQQYDYNHYSFTKFWNIATEKPKKKAENPNPEAPKAKKNTKVAQYTGVKTIPLIDLYTDEKRFQNRKKLNEEIVENIVNNFKPTDLDPLVVWYDKKQGKTFVLAGHHRFEALKRLKHKNVPVKFANDDYPTEADAIRYAKEISNANRTLEEPYERAAIYRKYREEGYSEKEINDKAALEGKNRSYILNLSCLNPKGATMSTLVQFSQTQSKADKNEAERVADWIGQARRNAPELTDAHEKEMFDFLMNKEASKRTTTKVKFLEYVRACWNPFEPTAPLNLARMKYQSEGEKQYDEEVERYKTLISDLQNNIGNLKDRFINPANKDFVNPEAPDYMAVKKIADNKIAEYNTQIQYYQKELLKLYSNKQSYLKPTGQIALFGSLPIFKTLKEAKKYFKAWAYKHLRGKKVFHKELDKYVVFSSKGIDHVLSSKISLKKMYLIQQAEEMLKNSHLIAFVEDYKKRDNIKGAYRMRTTATFEGEEVKVILTLREGENGVIYYDHKIEEIEESTTPPRKSRANPFCGDSAPTNTPAKTVPNTLANRQIDRLAVPTVYVEHLPEISTSANTLDAKMAALQTRNWETFVIANPQLQRFLGDVERKTSESTVITIAGGAGSGKTRFAFQFINALAQNYKVGHASLEEHPDSKLYYDKVQQYIDETALPNIEAPEIKDLDQLEALIQRNEVIVIDSFAKLQELNPRFLLDRDLRKKYDGKLFLLIYQLTGDGKMRGGSKSEFDGDIILLTHVAPDYRENYIYPSKNRYNALPATELRYSTYFQQMLDIPKELGTGRQPTEAISLPPAPQTNVYEVIY